MNYIEISEDRYTTVKLTFKRATPKSDYVRILKLCMFEPKTLQEIYPGKHAPLAAEVVALAKQGYLQKYTTEKHIHNTKRHHGFFNTVNEWYSKVWYKTTDKGATLVNYICNFK